MAGNLSSCLIDFDLRRVCQLMPSIRGRYALRMAMWELPEGYGFSLDTAADSRRGCG